MTAPTTFTVHVDDNYHYMDRDARYMLGEFESLSDAVKAAQAIVDGYLSSNYTPGMSAAYLYQSYTMFGEDPFIVGPENSPFSAWKYAEAQCEVMCAVTEGNNGEPASSPEPSTPD